MVTAILPCMTDESSRTSDSQKSPNPARNSLALSLDSQATITPERFLNHGAASSSGRSGPCKSRGGPSALAGYVGFFTGCGALVALLLFLPLPTRFGRIDGVTLGQAVEYSFYVVGAVSFLVAAFVFFGLRNLNGEDGKGWRTLLALRNTGTDESLEQLTAEQVIRSLLLTPSSLLSGLTHPPPHRKSSRTWISSRTPYGLVSPTPK